MSADLTSKPRVGSATSALNHQAVIRPLDDAVLDDIPVQPAAGRQREIRTSVDDSPG
jgi:hypothetical protein